MYPNVCCGVLFCTVSLLPRDHFSFHVHQTVVLNVLSFKYCRYYYLYRMLCPALPAMHHGKLQIWLCSRGTTHLAREL